MAQLTVFITMCTVSSIKIMETTYTHNEEIVKSYFVK